MRPSASPSVSVAAAKSLSSAMSLLTSSTAKTPSKERGSGSANAGAAAAATTAAAASKGPPPPLLPVASSSCAAPGVGGQAASPSGRPRALARLVVALLACAAVVNSLSCGSPLGCSRSSKSAAKAGSEKALASLRAISSLRGDPGSWGAVLSGAWTGGGRGEDVAPATAAATSSSSSPSSSSSSSPPPATDLLIPRVIHQTYRSEAELPPAAARLMLTWRARNPTWRVRFWDDADCLAFVEAEFPRWARAYRALPKDVERSDFFRYLVVLRYGGVYADVDTECRVPLDELLAPTDTLVVGWENEFATASKAAARKYVRKRQVLQWVFAGAPGHPALRAACEHVASHAWSEMSRAGNTDTLERTGPGALTDAVLGAAAPHAPAGARSVPWGVRVLPKASFGAHPRGLDGVDPRDPRVAVLHHYLGTWKSVRGWAPGGGLLGAAVAALLPGALAPKGGGGGGLGGAGGGGAAGASSGGARGSSSSSSWSLAAAAGANAATGKASAGGGRGEGGNNVTTAMMEAALPFDSAAPQLYPVSLLATSAPPVTALVPLVGSSERVGGEDVAAALTTYGAWQPGGPPARALLRRAAAAAAGGGGPKSTSSSSSSSTPSPFGDEPTPIEALLGGLDAATLASKRAAEAEEEWLERRRRREEKEEEEEKEASKGEGGGVGGKKNGDGAPSSPSASSNKKGDNPNSASGTKDHRAILLDLGAGLGAASLAAAARGHRVVAAEAGPQNAAALRASALYNGFEDLIELHEVAVGSGSSSGNGSTNGEIVIPSLACLDEAPPSSASAALSGGASSSRLFTDAARGYGARPPPKVVTASPSSSASASASSPAACGRTARRVHAASLVPPSGGARVGAVRVSAPGWEDLVLDGLLRRLHAASSAAASASSSASSSALPAVLLIELDVAALNAAAASAAAATPPSARARRLGPAEEGEDESELLGGRDEEVEEDSLYFIADDGEPSSRSPSPPRRPRATTAPSSFPSLVGSDAPTLLAKLRSLGYVHASHSGAACGARWRALARSLGLPPPGPAAAARAAAAEALALSANGTAAAAAKNASAASSASFSASSSSSSSPSSPHAAAAAGRSGSSGNAKGEQRDRLPPSALAPPVWCRLPPSEVAAFERAALSARTAETVLLIHASAVEGGEGGEGGDPASEEEVEGGEAEERGV